MRLIATIFATSMMALLIMLAGPASQADAASKNSENDKKPTTVTVKPGDYLSKIADKHDTTYKRLYNANPKISHPDVIYPGQKIRIPTANEKLKNRQLPANAVGAPAAPAVTTTAAKAPAATPRKQPTPTNNATTPPSSGVWDQLAQCESGGNWSINTGNGYYGGLQFSQSSWHSVGGSGSPSNASKAEQIARAQQLQSIQGWGAWPACSAKLGLL